MTRTMPPEDAEEVSTLVIARRFRPAVTAPWHPVLRRHDAFMLRLDGVAKSFYDRGRGEVRAVDGIEAELGDGVCALVGANGAGKSTLLRLITTLLMPDRGRVLLDGLDTRTDAERIRRRLAYLSSTTRIYQRLTGRELLRYVGGFFGLTGAALEARIEVMAAAFALEAFLDQRIEGLSTGQLQRVNLARTLLPDPDLLVLDEPTTGLDVLAARSLVEAVLAARRPGRLILIATHVLREVELCADRLLVLRQGRVVHDGAPATLGGGSDFEASIHAMLHAADAAAGTSP
jgi:sodium transport system ATP-binding protein